MTRSHLNHDLSEFLVDEAMILVLARAAAQSPDHPQHAALLELASPRSCVLCFPVVDSALRLLYAPRIVHTDETPLSPAFSMSLA